MHEGPTNLRTAGSVAESTADKISGDHAPLIALYLLRGVEGLDAAERAPHFRMISDC